MNNHQTESRLRRAYEHATPDVLEAVRTACSQTKGETYTMTKQEKALIPWRKILAVAAAVVLLAGAAVGVALYTDRRPATTVSLDVNPALSITLKRDATVLAVTPHNEDARRVVGDMELAGNDLTLVVNALIGSMLRQGYLDDRQNSILVSVEDSDRERGETLRRRLTDQIDGLLHTDTLTGAVLSQTVDTADKQLKDLAEEHGITLGKARLIQQIVTQNTRHTFAELAGLTVHELNLISSRDTGSTLDNVASTGIASDKGYIGVEAAKTAATFDAIGDTEPEIEWLDGVEMDYENGRMVYELEFAVMGVEYEYAIDALTGAVVKKESEKADDGREDHRPGTTTTTGKPSATTATTAPSASQRITAEQAKAAALAHAGIKAADARKLTCEQDYEDGRLVYEVDFTAGQTEYDYVIDATTGKVLEYDRERDD